MKINKENYETYFLDYFEKQLSPDQMAELMVFLEENPDLKAEFEAFELIKLEAENTIASGLLTKLKKPEYKSAGDIDAWNYEEKMAAYVEGDLNEVEKQEFKKFININPNARLELNMFRKSILIPEDISYPNKSELKKSGVILLFDRPLLYAVSAAAMIIILFGIFTLLRQGTQQDAPSQMTEVEIPMKLQQEIPVDQEPITPPKERDQFAASIMHPENIKPEDEIFTRVESIQNIPSADLDKIALQSFTSKVVINPVYASATIDLC